MTLALCSTTTPAAADVVVIFPEAGSSVGNDGVSEASVLESSQMALVSLVLDPISSMEASVGEVMALEMPSSSLSSCSSESSTSPSSVSNPPSSSADSS